MKACKNTEIRIERNNKKNKRKLVTSQRYWGHRNLVVNLKYCITSLMSPRYYRSIYGCLTIKGVNVSQLPFLGKKIIQFIDNIKQQWSLFYKCPRHWKKTRRHFKSKQNRKVTQCQQVKHVIFSFVYICNKWGLLWTI